MEEIGHHGVSFQIFCWKPGITYHEEGKYLVNLLISVPRRAGHI